MTYYTPAQLSDMLHVHITTVYRNRQLPWQKVGRVLRISQVSLDKYLGSAKRPLLPPTPTRCIIAAGGQLDMGKKRGGYYNYGYGGVYSRRGKKLTRWYIDYREGAVRRRVMVKGAVTVEDALRELQKRMRSLNGAAKYSTFKEYAQKYLDTYSKKNRSHGDNEQRMGVAKDYFGDMDLREIEPSKVAAFHSSRVEGGNTKSTANRYLSLVKRLFHCAMLDGYLERNPAEFVKAFSEKEYLKERILTTKEEPAFLAALPQPHRDMAQLSLNTGMREGEIMDLPWSRVDFKRRDILVEYTKSGKYRHVPMNQTAYVLLSSLFKNGERFVFVNKRTGKPYVNILKVYEKYRDEAGFGDVRFHDLRHTFATRLAGAGVPLHVIQRILGHSDIKTTQRYLHVAEESALDAVEMLSSQEPTGAVIENETRTIN